MPPRITLTALGACAALLAGCATPGSPACAPGAQRAVSELLYFGTARPGGVVSAEEWSEFLATAVTPRFPQGLSAWPATGQWRSADGSLTRENSYVLNLLHPDDDAEERAVRAITDEYKARFRQEAVLRVRSVACVTY